MSEELRVWSGQAPLGEPEPALRETVWRRRELELEPKVEVPVSVPAISRQQERGQLSQARGCEFH